MRTKALRRLMCWAAVIVLSLALVPIRAAGYGYTADEVDDLIGGILAYKLDEAGADDVQEWIDGYLSKKAGVMSEWYIIALSQDGVRDMGSYERALKDYIGSNKINSATTREKYALALCAAGSSDSYIADILDDSIGATGIMSRIYGLHILNNGYTCNNYTAESVADELLSMQYNDGGWALFGEYGDIDVTAMTIQALAPYYDERGDVHSAIDRGLELLSRRQMDDGGYQSFGTPNPESSAQVVVALSALGIDCCEDSRFIKDGNTIIDSMLTYRLADGGYCHVAGGDFNETATIQAMYSFVAYKRMLEGEGSLYVIDARQPVSAPVQTTAAAQTSIVTSAQTGTSAVTTAVPHSSASAKATTVSAASATSATAAGMVITLASGTESHISSSVKLPTASTSAATSTAAVSSADNGDGKGCGYKPIAIIVIIGAGALLSVLLLALGKRSYKNFLFVGAAAAAGVVIVLVTDIRSAKDYYGSASEKSNAVGTVTMEIRCDTVVGKSDADYIPEDGVILPVTAFDIEAGDTVYDVLTDAAQTYGIQIDARGGSKTMIYVAGINYIYEFDFGDLSGWVYHVNGISPSRNSGDYVLEDGDVIEWLYTCELGHDLNEVYEE
ncbi:MAG: DUF4430 domain-containing protein [Ruminococcus sp.]|nr:DUF4430 domain-containing protein [Ruminococcus sp.]